MIKRIKDAIDNAVESIRDKHRRKKYGSGEGFQWISAEEEESDEASDPMPMFYVGDDVHIFNPHMGALYQDWDSISPNLYRVTDVIYDDSDETFRYKLNGWSGGYVSEDWLSLPFYSKFEKNIEEAENVKEMSVGEREEFFLGMDEKAQKREIDRLLDVMNSGSEAEVTKAKARLTELTEM